MTDLLRRQRPHGLNELYDEQAAIKTALEDRLHEVFDLWGYRRIILPTFGYYESLSAGTSPDLQRQMFRFFDREGNIMALRADMTPLTARLVGTIRFYSANAHMASGSRLEAVLPGAVVAVIDVGDATRWSILDRRCKQD